METNGYLLSIDDIHLNFGGILALNGVSFGVMPGEVVSIIGPNGAGKTCVLNCITGFYRPVRGSIQFKGTEINRFPTYKIAALGIARTFQNIQLFTGLTALENLMAARHIYQGGNFITDAFFFGKSHDEELKGRKEVEEIIKFLEIEAVRNVPVGALPYGLRKRVDLGRALALKPKVLLLDEPMAGMNVDEKSEMARFIMDTREEQGCAVIVVEHDMALVMDISDRVFVLDFGQKIAEGPPEVIRQNERVIQAYLGTEELYEQSE